MCAGLREIPIIAHPCSSRALVRPSPIPSVLPIMSAVFPMSVSVFPIPEEIACILHGIYYVPGKRKQKNKSDRREADSGKRIAGVTGGYHRRTRVLLFPATRQASQASNIVIGAKNQFSKKIPESKLPIVLRTKKANTIQALIFTKPFNFPTLK